MEMELESCGKIVRYTHLYLFIKCSKGYANRVHISDNALDLRQARALLSFNAHSPRHERVLAQLNFGTCNSCYERNSGKSNKKDVIQSIVNIILSIKANSDMQARSNLRDIL